MNKDKQVTLSRENDAGGAKLAAAVVQCNYENKMKTRRENSPRLLQPKSVNL